MNRPGSSHIRPDTTVRMFGVRDGWADPEADPTRIDPTTNPSQGFAVQIVKDLAGDWVSGLLGD